MKIKRGNLYTADLNPRYGTEAGKVRPVLVIQTNLMNEDHPSTLICPLTSQVRLEIEILRIHLKKGEAGLSKDSDIIIDQIRAIDNQRLKEQIGKLSATRMSEVEGKLKIVLDLS